MNRPEINLDELIRDVQSNRYARIEPGLVRRIVLSEMQKGRKPKEIIKESRSKLHQVAVAYQEKPIPYNNFSTCLASLSTDLSNPAVKDYCRQVMACHTSTAERLPILEPFYETILTPLAPIHSILDLACGLNPLARPWMPLEKEAQYFASDIFDDLVGFLNLFFNHFHQNGKGEMIDLCEFQPLPQTDVALLLKSVPCLEQLDKNLISDLLLQIPAKFILVSFPVHSLGGKQKGMAKFYGDHFEKILENLPFTVQIHTFQTELVYCLNKNQE